jgi:hypothetical protein
MGQQVALFEPSLLPIRPTPSINKQILWDSHRSHLTKSPPQTPNFPNHFHLTARANPDSVSLKNSVSPPMGWLCSPFSNCSTTLLPSLFAIAVIVSRIADFEFEWLHNESLTVEQSLIISYALLEFSHGRRSVYPCVFIRHFEFVNTGLNGAEDGSSARRIRNQ